MGGGKAGPSLSGPTLLTRVERHEVNDPRKAPEKLNWLFKCKIINQEKEGNKQRIGGKEAIAWSTETRRSVPGSWMFQKGIGFEVL